MVEEWRDVKANNLYQVSNLGRVRRSKPRSDGKPGGLRIGKILKASKDGGGYKQVGLTRNNVRKSHHIHRLVAEAFLGPRPERADVNHKNGIKIDNRVENLEYCSRKENQRHAVKIGIQKVGSARHNSRFTEAEVLQMRQMAHGGQLYATIARRFDVNPRMVRKICIGEAWKHVGGPIQGARRITHHAA